MPESNPDHEESESEDSGLPSISSTYSILTPGVAYSGNALDHSAATFVDMDEDEEKDELESEEGDPDELDPEDREEASRQHANTNEIVAADQSESLQVNEGGNDVDLHVGEAQEEGMFMCLNKLSVLIIKLFISVFEALEAQLLDALHTTADVGT